MQSTRLLKCLTLVSIGCSSPQSSQTSAIGGFESKEEVIFELGIQRGRLEEQQKLYQRAIKELEIRRAGLDSNFEDMSLAELNTFQEVNQVLIQTYKLTNAKPAQRAFDFMAKVRDYSGRTKIALKYVEEATPVFQNMIAQIETMNSVHDSFVTMLSDLGAIFPFVRNWFVLQDHVIQSYIAMKISSINAALFTTVATHVRRGDPIDLKSWHMGLVDDTAFRLGSVESYWQLNPNLEPWFTVTELREVMHKGLNVKSIPLPKWRCTYRVRRIENLENADELRGFLDTHAERIYILIDEIRMQYGTESFPISMGPIKNLTEVGDSRVWRKPMVMAKIDAELNQAKALLVINQQVIEILTAVKDLFARDWTVAQTDDNQPQ